MTRIGGMGVLEGLVVGDGISLWTRHEDTVENGDAGEEGRDEEGCARILGNWNGWREVMEDKLEYQQRTQTR